MSKPSKKKIPASVKVKDLALWKQFTEECDRKGLIYQIAVQKALALYLKSGMPMNV